MNSEIPPRWKNVSPIVRIVLSQAARRRARAEISEETFQLQMQRLSKEELEPKGMALICRDLADHRVRFLVKDAQSGTVCDLVEFPPQEESGSEPEAISAPLFGEGLAASA